MKKTIPIKQLPVTTGNTPSLPYEITKSILETKRPVNGEIELTLFENCNIVCEFCHHDKDSTVGMSWEEMVSKLETVEDFVSSRAPSIQFMQFNIVGGELFQDRDIQRLCDLYEQLAYELKNICDRYDLPMRIVWVTNMLFASRSVVEALIDALEHDGIENKLIVSYDFDGRPLSNRYRDNIEHFGPRYIDSINCVGTAPSIEKFMEDDDEFFKYLYENFQIYFDDYIPDRGFDYLIPSDQLFYDWYVFIIDNYPNISPVKELLENRKNQMHCLSLNKLTIFPDGSTSNCRWNRYDQDDFNTKFDRSDNAGMMQEYLDENQCLSCEFFDRCGFRCFTQWDWTNRIRNVRGCTMKKIFYYITEKQNGPSN